MLMAGIKYRLSAATIYQSATGFVSMEYVPWTAAVQIRSLIARQVLL